MFEPKSRINAKVAQCYYRAWILLKALQESRKIPPKALGMPCLLF